MLISPHILQHSSHICKTSAQANTMQQQTFVHSSKPLLGLRAPLPTRRAAQRCLVRAEGKAEGDSYEKIEAPVRKTWPAGSDVGAQNFGPRQSEADEFFKSKTANPDTQVLGTKVGVADAMRFKGAAPEVLNGRLSMLGFVLAILGEQLTGKNILEQFNSWPGVVGAVIALFTVATLVPIVKGVPREGNNVFSSNAELINGRLAMLGVAALVWNAWI